MANQPSTNHTLKQIRKMGACCAGPILGLALLAPLASSLGIGVSSIFSFLLVLACPLSMLVMMYFMRRGSGSMRSQGQVEERLRPATPQETHVPIAGGNEQPEEREALPFLEESQASPVREQATRTPQISRPQG